MIEKENETLIRVRHIAKKQKIEQDKVAFNLLAGLRLTTPRVGGIIPFSTIKTALMSAESPLAASLCPMFVLTYSLP